MRFVWSQIAWGSRLCPWIFEKKVQKKVIQILVPRNGQSNETGSPTLKFPDFGTFNQSVIGAVLYSRSPYWYYSILFTFPIHPSVLISLYSWYIYIYVSDIDFGKLSVTSFPSFK
jgi:hypothetical protein